MARQKSIKKQRSTKKGTDKVVKRSSDYNKIARIAYNLSKMRVSVSLPKQHNKAVASVMRYAGLVDKAIVKGKNAVVKAKQAEVKKVAKAARDARKLQRAKDKAGRLKARIAKLQGQLEKLS